MLGVESPLVCDLLHHADPLTGIFPADIVDTLGNNDATKTVDNLVFGDNSDLPKTVTTKVTKKTSYKSGHGVNHEESKSREEIESVEVINGVTTTVKKVIVDGVVIDEERIQEKDGKVVGHSQVMREDIDQPNVEYEAMDALNDESNNKDSNNDDKESDKPSGKDEL